MTFRYYHSLTGELNALNERARFLLHNQTTTSALKKTSASVLRTILRRYLPDYVRVGQGFIVLEDETSPQIDVLLYRSNSRILFQENDFVMVNPNDVLGVISVASEITDFLQLSTFLANLADLTGEINNDTSNDPVSFFDSPGNQINSKSLFTGLFAFDYQGKEFDQEIVNELFSISRLDPTRVIDSLVLGERRFFQYQNQPESLEVSLQNWNKYSFQDYQVSAPAITCFLGKIIEHFSSVPLNKAFPNWLPNQEELVVNRTNGIHNAERQLQLELVTKVNGKHKANGKSEEEPQMIIPLKSPVKVNENPSEEISQVEEEAPVMEKQPREVEVEVEAETEIAENTSVENEGEEKAGIESEEAISLSDEMEVIEPVEEEILENEVIETAAENIQTEEELIEEKPEVEKITSDKESEKTAEAIEEKIIEAKELTQEEEQEFLPEVESDQEVMDETGEEGEEGEEGEITETNTTDQTEEEKIDADSESVEEEAIEEEKIPQEAIDDVVEAIEIETEDEEVLENSVVEESSSEEKYIQENDKTEIENIEEVEEGVEEETIGEKVEDSAEQEETISTIKIPVKKPVGRPVNGRKKSKPTRKKVEPKKDIVLVEGNTVLHQTVLNGDLNQVAEVLEQNLPMLEEKNKAGDTPLHLAVENDFADIVELLIQQGANVNSRNYVYASPLHVAVMGDLPEITELLIQYGAEVEVRNNRAHTPLHKAAIHGCTKAAKVLIENYADVHSRMEKDMQPLHLAAWYGQGEIAAMLIENDADLNSVNSDGNSALHFAAFNGQVKVIKILINHDADPTIVNKSGETYLQGLNEGYSGEMIKVLE